MENRYINYTGSAMITVPMRKIYTDSEGYPNENAFRDFAEHISAEYYLACISVDVSKSNEKKGYGFGTRVLRKAFLQLKDNFYIFRMSGNKFNLLVTENEFPKLKEMLESGNEDFFTVYYGLIEDTYITKDNYKALCERGKEMMYRHKAEKIGKAYSEARDDVVIGDKGNTPTDLQETDTCKYRETMWYSTISLEESEPVPRMVTIHVFPTEYKESLASLNIIVVIDDFVSTRTYSGTNITFGLDGMKFSVSARFDNEGHMNVSCYEDRNNTGKCEISVDTHEGNCIPASFGKRVGNGLSVFPVKSNSRGTYEYVLWNDNNKTVEYNESGLIEMDGITYGVHSDKVAINLINE